MRPPTAPSGSLLVRGFFEHRVPLGMQMVTQQHAAPQSNTVTCAHRARESSVTKRVLTVPADAQQVSQVLGNLLDNARRHAAGRIDVQVARTTNGAVITVVDDGPGIPPADRERVFDRLVRLDST